MGGAPAVPRNPADQSIHDRPLLLACFPSVHPMGRVGPQDPAQTLGVIQADGDGRDGGGSSSRRSVARSLVGRAGDRLACSRSHSIRPFIHVGASSAARVRPPQCCPSALPTRRARVVVIGACLREAAKRVCLQLADADAGDAELGGQAVVGAR